MSQTVSILPNPSNGLVDEFGNGIVTNYRADYFTVPAALATQAQSLWFIAQWAQPVYINSANFTQNSPSTYDPIYGNAVYSWTEPDTTAAIAMYQNTAALGGGDVYDLTDGNTTLPPSSGGIEEADMFLSSPAATASNLSHPITISLNAKLAQSKITFATPALAAQYATSGTVFGTFDIGITVNFNGAGGLPAFSGFVQIVPWTSDSPALANYETGALSTNDPAAQFISSTLLAGDPSLPLLSADAGANPDSLSYNVNQYVYNTLVIAYANFSAVQKTYLLNLANWTLGSVYIGPATVDTGVTNAAGAVSLVAKETVGIQVSAVNVATNLDATYSPTAATSPGTKVDTNPQIIYYDNTSQGGGTADGSVYNGPISGIQDKYIYTGADSIGLAAPVGANWEFGGGSAATELTATSGKNVFVASSGGSTMIGGTGNDTFDLPDANVTGVSTWDTIINFHVGDTVSLAGIGGTGWTYSWHMETAPTGAAALTLIATSTVTMGLSEYLSFAGLTLADLPALLIKPEYQGNAGGGRGVQLPRPVNGVLIVDAALSPSQLASPSVPQAQALTSQQISRFNGAKMSALPASDIAGLSDTQIAALTSAGLVGLEPAEINRLTLGQRAALTPSALSGLKSSDMAAINPSNIAAISKMQFLAIPDAAITAITSAQMQAISARQMPEFSAPQIASLNLGDIAAMTGVHATGLSADQKRALTDLHVSKLNPWTLHQLSVFQSHAFSLSHWRQMIQRNAMH